MTPAKQEALMQGQTGIAKKVFECVPIAEAWSSFQVMTALRNLTGSTSDTRIVSGCLTSLADAGLIKKTGRDAYQRIPVEQKQKPKEQKMTVPATKPVPQVEQKSVDVPLELLGEMAGEVVAMAENMKRLAKRIEDYALVLEQGREATAKSLEGYRQLKALLKGLQEDAE